MPYILRMLRCWQPHGATTLCGTTLCPTPRDPPARSHTRASMHAAEIVRDCARERRHAQQQHAQQPARDGGAARSAPAAARTAPVRWQQRRWRWWRWQLRWPRRCRQWRRWRSRGCRRRRWRRSRGCTVAAQRGRQAESEITWQGMKQGCTDRAAGAVLWVMRGEGPAGEAQHALGKAQHSSARCAHRMRLDALVVYEPKSTPSLDARPIMTCASWGRAGWQRVRQARFGNGRGGGFG